MLKDGVITDVTAPEQLFDFAKELAASYDLLLFVHDNGKLPVVNFAAGGIATPADAALMMQLGSGVAGFAFASVMAAITAVLSEGLRVKSYLV